MDFGQSAEGQSSDKQACIRRKSRADPSLLAAAALLYDRQPRSSKWRGDAPEQLREDDHGINIRW